MSAFDTFVTNRVGALALLDLIIADQDQSELTERVAGVKTFIEKMESDNMKYKNEAEENYRAEMQSRAVWYNMEHDYLEKQKELRKELDDSHRLLTELRKKYRTLMVDYKTIKVAAVAAQEAVAETVKKAVAAAAQERMASELEEEKEEMSAMTAAESRR